MTTPDSVAVFSSSFAPHIGGVEEMCRRLIREQRRQGITSFVITNRYPKDLASHATVDGIDVNRVRFRFPEPKPRHLAGFAIGTLTSRRTCRELLRQRGAQLVHVQCVSTNGYYALRAARDLGLPLVVTLHGELTMDATQVYQRSATMRRMWRELMGYASVVTGCSQQVIDEAIDFHGPGLADKCRVIRNGVDVDLIRAAVPETRTRPFILGLGRLVRQKGFDLLIDAFADVALRHPELDLVIAGDGPERQSLEEQAARLPINARIQFLGAVPASRAFSLFRAASAFVLCSRHEPQGIVLLEAMAAGTPILATDVGGVGETIGHRRNGVLCAGGSAPAIAAGLTQILDDPDASGSYVRTASTDILRYQWSALTVDYSRAYADARGSR